KHPSEGPLSRRWPCVGAQGPVTRRGRPERPYRPAWPAAALHWRAGAFNGGAYASGSRPVSRTTHSANRRSTADGRIPIPESIRIWSAWHPTTRCSVSPSGTGTWIAGSGSSALGQRTGGVPTTSLLIVQVLVLCDVLGCEASAL